MHRASRLLPLAGATVFCFSAAAGPHVVEFSATVVHSAPNQPSVVEQVFVGSNSMRADIGTGEQRLITIMDMQQRKAWMVNPTRKEYMEMPVRPGQSDATRPAGGRPPLPGESGHPCVAGQGFECKRLGNEPINGRQTEKWEIVDSRGEQRVRSLLWVDRELGANIREEIPGGFVRELRDIRVGAQPAHVFQVPADYRRVAPPKQPAGVEGQRP